VGALIDVSRGGAEVRLGCFECPLCLLCALCERVCDSVPSVSPRELVGVLIITRRRRGVVVLSDSVPTVCPTLASFHAGCDGNRRVESLWLALNEIGVVSQWVC
jgi:hypothetical protein